MEARRYFINMAVKLFYFYILIYSFVDVIISIGFCDRNSNTYYTKQNPKFYDFTLRNCFVSCQFGCGAVSSETRDEL